MTFSTTRRFSTTARAYGTAAVRPAEPSAASDLGEAVVDYRPWPFEGQSGLATKLVRAQGDLVRARGRFDKLAFLHSRLHWLRATSKRALVPRVCCSTNADPFRCVCQRQARRLYSNPVVIDNGRVVQLLESAPSGEDTSCTGRLHRFLSPFRQQSRDGRLKIARSASGTRLRTGANDRGRALRAREPRLAYMALASLLLIVQLSTCPSSAAVAARGWRTRRWRS